MSEHALRSASAPEAKVFVLSPDGSRHTQLTRTLSIEYEVLMNDVGQLRLEVELSPTTEAVFLQSHPDEAIPIIVQAGAMETLWLTTNVVEWYEGSTPTIQVVAVSPEKYLETLYAWPLPEAPAEAQVNKEGTYVGPVVTVVKQLLNRNFRRMTWRKDRLHYVAPEAPADQYSRMVIIQVKMNPMLDLIKDLIDTEALTIAASVYLPGRGQTPPSGHDPKRPAIMWNVEQRAKLPSGGVMLRGFVRTLQDFWSDIWSSLTLQDQSVDAVKYWGEPQLMIRKHQYASLRIETVKPTAWRYTVGGQSPQWINILSQMAIGTAINVASGGLGVMLNSSAVAQIGNNRIMSYHSWPDGARMRRMGPFGMMEAFAPTVGLTVDALTTIKRLQLKSRSTKAHEFQLLPTVGLQPGVDYRVGSMLSLELPGDRYVVAFVTSIRYTWTDEGAPQVEVQVADRPVRDPLDASLRQIKGVTSLINKVALLTQ